MSQLTGIPVQPNKAIVGENAFAHEAEMYQEAMLKNPLTYEIMTPQSVGWSNTKLVMGKHSGRHALDARLRQLGHKLDGSQLKIAYSRFMVLAEEKKQIADEEFGIRNLLDANDVVDRRGDDVGRRLCGAARFRRRRLHAIDYTGDRADGSRVGPGRRGLTPSALAQEAGQQ